MLRAAVIAVTLMSSTVVAAEPPAAVRAHAVRRVGELSINGRLDEPAWADAPKQTGFIQRFPTDGVEASYTTRFSVLYDDDAIYVGVWAADPEPDRIRALLTRRDVDGVADSIAVGIDSYRDRRTAYVFQLNAAGVQRDTLLFDDSNQDDTWDAVWTGDVAISDQGWTAEFRIPLNQLRFATSESHEWGLQIFRLIGRSQERDTWSPWPRSGQAEVSRFGVVDGIDHIKAGTRLELLPYASAGFARLPVAASDPLNTRYDVRRDIGLDLKYGLGPAFTVSATLNPDFGQVEADPSKINLSANELFFAEKRPFFTEGVELFKLPIGNSDNSPEGAFYSRRIGAAPGSPAVSYKYIRAPSSTTIYAATKLSGKAHDWSVGLFDAVTGQEQAKIVGDDDTQSTPVIAPLTNYVVARIKRDLRDGKTSLGASATTVDRSLAGTGLEARLHDHAYSGGLQLQHRFWGNAWQANISAVGSWVHGSQQAIALTQQSAQHYFQRPDATDVHFDPTRRSLAGLGLTWSAGRLGDTKHWRYGVGGDLRTSGLELNDAGFQQNSDGAIPFASIQYHDEEPTKRVLNWQASSDVYIVQTLEPRITNMGFECSGNVQLANYWLLSAGCTLDRARWSTNALRGGSALRVDPRVAGSLTLISDTRKSVGLSLNAWAGRDWRADEFDGGIDLGATIQARSNIELFVGPSYSFREDPMQYISEARDTRGTPHFVFARLSETTAAITLRANWTFSPHLTLQAYAQPFVAAGAYSELKDVDNPGAEIFGDRFHLLTASEYSLMRPSPDAGGTYHVIRDGAAYSVDRPDFDLRQLRSTIVLRWEYRPGSTVFAIWSHGRTSTAPDGQFRPARDLSALGDSDSSNVVMIKANYWIGL